MYKNIRVLLEGLKEKELIAIIDEGRSRKSKKKCKIEGIYSRIFTIKADDILLSFSYSDLICKTITLKKV